MHESMATNRIDIQAVLFMIRVCCWRSTTVLMMKYYNLCEKHANGLKEHRTKQIQRLTFIRRSKSRRSVLPEVPPHEEEP
jgi:hypothetical protein